MSNGDFNSNIKRIENLIQKLYYYRNDIESTKKMTEVLDKRLIKRYNIERKRKDNSKNLTKYRKNTIRKVR